MRFFISYLVEKILGLLSQKRKHNNLLRKQSVAKELLWLDNFQMKKTVPPASDICSMAALTSPCLNSWNLSSLMKSGVEVAPLAVTSSVDVADGIPSLPLRHVAGVVLLHEMRLVCLIEIVGGSFGIAAASRSLRFSHTH